MSEGIKETFRQAMREAGFGIKQQEFFEEWMSLKDHSHVAEDINGLEETVAELVEMELKDEEEEEEG
jgi:coenzyme F420-reducing hydrogenase delta subunit